MNNVVTENVLISIVVPVYNVADYMRKCLDSIIAQTYKPIEIILVDDGATDNSSEICDEYEQRYPQLINVVHQKNRGLSGARNTGLSYAHGEYITFVDSDDWIAPDMVETMYRNLKKYDAQISGVSFYKTFEDGKKIKVTSKTEISVMSREETLGKFLFNENMNVCVCGKLYLTSLWDIVKCPEGKLFEDQYTTYKLIDQAETVVYDPSPKYYYVQRNGSIAHSSFTEKTYDLYEGVQEQYGYIVNKYPKLQSQLFVAKITWEIVFFNMMFRAGKNDKLLVEKTRNFARKHIKDVLRCEEINVVRKIQIALFAYWIWGYKKVYFAYIR